MKDDKLIKELYKDIKTFANDLIECCNKETETKKVCHIISKLENRKLLLEIYAIQGGE